MNESKNAILLVALAITFTVLVVVFPEEALARAGGGGGGKSGGIITIILLPFLLIYSFIISRYIARKHRKAKTIIAKISQLDDGWSLDKINDRIELIFLKVQEAWMARDQEIARDYVSNRLFAKHKAQTDQMLSEGTKNFLQRVNLKKVTIVEVADYNENSKDRIWAVLSGSMVDIIVDAKTNQIMSGDPDKVDNFKELWKFIRDPQKGWVLDEIDQEVEISDLKSFRSFSESLGANPPPGSQGQKISLSYTLSILGLGLILPWVIAIAVFLQYKGYIFK